MSDAVASRPFAHGLSMLVGFALAVGLSVQGLLFIADALEVEPGPGSVARAAELQLKLKRVASVERRLRSVAYVGDSTVVTYLPGRQLPNRLQKRLRDGPRPVEDVVCQSVAHPGIGAFSFYYLADSIARAKPDLLLLQTSFIHYSVRWMRSNDRAELAGWIGTRRFVESLFLPLRHNGLRLDRQLLYQAIVELGLVAEWRAMRGVHSRVEKLRPRLESRMASFGGTPERNFERQARWEARVHTRLADRPMRFDRAASRRFFGPALDGLSPDHPALVMLAAGLRHLRDEGIPVLVYLSPLNHEHLASLDLVDPVKLTASILTLRAVVEDAGADFVDAHDPLQDRHFRDSLGHFMDRDGVDGPLLLLDRLEQPVRQRLEALP